MSVICACPLAASLATIPAMGCGENFGQIQKIAFQRLHDEDGNLNGFATATPIGTLSSWQTLMAETDETKIVVTPFVEAPTQDGGDAITFGGGNDTLGGEETIVGRNATTMSFALRKYPQEIIKVLKGMQCENDLGVYLFSENGAIEAIKGAATGDYHPIPIRSLFVGDKIHGGLETPDNNTLSFNFLPNYSDDLVIVAPSFNPLTDL